MLSSFNQVLLKICYLRFVRFENAKTPSNSLRPPSSASGFPENVLTGSSGPESPSNQSREKDQSIAVLPNLLGFTLGGFAIFIGFGDEKFRALLAEPAAERAVNDYVALCAHFVHFIAVQAVALMVAIVVKSFQFYSPIADPIRDWLPCLNATVGAFGYLLFLYALTSVLAATMHVFRIARLYSVYQSQSHQ